jgi:hypothetical protein
MMVAEELNVNLHSTMACRWKRLGREERFGREETTWAKETWQKRLGRKKKPGPREPGLRYWPREADTITFQEGLLNRRATGGGGHMRDTTAQRLSSMILISAVRQPSEPHVSHAVSGPSIK